MAVAQVVTRGFGPGATIGLVVTAGYHTEAPPVRVAVFAEFFLEPTVGGVFVMNEEPEP